jgi:hypothetical protein
MPQIVFKKKKKNLNELSSLYVSSEEESEDRPDTNDSKRYDGPETSLFNKVNSNNYGIKSIMSNYSTKMSKFNNTSRFK